MPLPYLPDHHRSPLDSDDWSSVGLKGSSPNGSQPCKVALIPWKYSYAFHYWNIELSYFDRKVISDYFSTNLICLVYMWQSGSLSVYADPLLIKGTVARMAIHEKIIASLWIMYLCWRYLLNERKDSLKTPFYGTLSLFNDLLKHRDEKEGPILFKAGEWVIIPTPQRTCRVPHLHIRVLPTACESKCAYKLFAAHCSRYFW